MIIYLNLTAHEIFVNVGVLRLDEDGRPHMKYDECWYCGCCEEKCPTKALKKLISYPVA